MNKTIVIYHGGCRDGFCAAWVVNKYFTYKFEEYCKSGKDYPGEITYHPGFYGQEPPDCKDKNVIIVDFCYPLEQMKIIAENCESLIWLDHHKTAQPVTDWFNKVMKPFSPILDKTKFIFDINRSGAGIAWDYFFPNEVRPWLVNYVEDRDLWKKQLNYSDIINAYIACLEFEFISWDYVNQNITQLEAKDAGHIAIMKTEQYVREVCKNVYFSTIKTSLSHPHMSPSDRLEILYENIPTVNICQVDCSEVLAELLKLYPNSLFSMYWFKRADGMYQYGLRSKGDFDVSSVAKLFGGGGHKNAAGFQLNYLLEELK